MSMSNVSSVVKFSPTQRLSGRPHVCVNCRHFTGVRMSVRPPASPHEQHAHHAHHAHHASHEWRDWNRCALFGEVNVVTGQTELAFAEVCRSVEGMCGLQARYFDPAM